MQEIRGQGMWHDRRVRLCWASVGDDGHRGLCRPRGTRAFLLYAYPPLKRWAILCRPAGGTGAWWLACLMRAAPSQRTLLEDFEMFRVRHCRVTSLTSAMLRMILTGMLRRPHSMRPSPPSQR